MDDLHFERNKRGCSSYSKTSSIVLGQKEKRGRLQKRCPQG